MKDNVCASRELFAKCVTCLIAHNEFMIDRGPATEHEMVLAFLQGEIDSPRFGQRYSTILQNWGLDRADLVDNADITSEPQRLIRIELLKAVRGYGADNALFRGFPVDVQWRRIALPSHDFPRLKYISHEPTLLALSGGTRCVVDGARNIGLIIEAKEANENIQAVAADMKAGKRYPPLIGVEGENGELILVEGHTRATAHVLAGLTENMELLVGSSSSMQNWAFY